ncbi:HAMP domain-containing protein [Paenibacillus hemerocallicola]|uniref:HAMP domain-containing protein n=1 Tax=Paenibacillus hemerocallicola TaxID=1172614 RepID=A0A5C4SYN0_9BACL|nr:sensor histidine kinase [Paenibacillus hemerocallicola]TNJ59195.1 HAMP domain-containing protein [Paenibacillus hemerocallicola]
MLQKWSFPTRLFAIYSLIVFLVIPLSSIVLYRYYKSIAYQTLSESFQWEVTTLAEQLDNVIVSADGLVVNTLVNPSIENWMKEQPDTNSNNKVVSVFNKMRLDLDIDPDSFNRISIIKDTGIFLTVGSTSLNRDQAKKKIADLSWFGDLQQRPLLVLPPHRDDWDSKGKMIVSVIRGGVPGTLLEVQIPFSYLEAMLFKGNFATNGNHVVLYDENNRIIYPTTEQEPPPGQNITAESRINHAGWRVEVTQPMELLLKSVRETGYWMAAIAGGLSLVSLVMIYFFTTRTTKPLVRLSQAMAQVPGDAGTNEQLSKLFEKIDGGDTHNEVVHLYRAFQSMLERMEESKQQAVEARSREFQAQFLALQAQMNPHFLYNTLTLIGMLGMEDGNDEILKITSELVQMLRYITYDSRELVTLKEEIDHALCYLDIMKTRYRDHLVFDVHLEGDLTAVRVPKLTVQPFVENCVKHGFAKKKYPWRIELDVAVTDTGWKVQIRDDGDGFSADYLQKFAGNRGKLGRLDLYAEGGGVGMLNTYIRLYHTFGSKLQFALSNNEAGGASVYLGLETEVATDVKNIAG